MPILRGLQLDRATVAFLEHTTNLIVENSSPADTIYVYPYAPLFYSLSGRQPSTFAFTGFIDVVPDEVAVEEAQRLLAARPAVIVYLTESDENLTLNEEIYRGGKRSGQRVLRRAIEKLAKEYRLLYSGQIPHSNQEIELYGRPKSKHAAHLKSRQRFAAAHTSGSAAADGF